jgi:hypothetical protein
MIHGVVKTSISILMVLVVAVLYFTPLLAYAGDGRQAEAISVPSWLEPHGIHVVDLVGVVPEEHLRNTIVTASPSSGIAQYAEGRRTGNDVTVTARLWPRFAGNGTLIGCLNNRVYSDYWPTTLPEFRMRVYSGNTNITPRIYGGVVSPAGLVQPVRGAKDSERYNEPPIGAITGAEEIHIPANRGCLIFVDGRHSDVTAVFTFSFEQKIQVKVLGEETFSFGGYRGPGYSGSFTTLQKQLQKYGNNHDKFELTIPNGADYVFVKFPPSTVAQDAIDDVDSNARQPGSGTYRLASGVSTLSVDHNVSMGLPLHAMWQDSDQARGRYLPILRRVNTVTSPEYFVPPGIEYDPCMTSGGCPESLMQQIVSKRNQMTVYYYRVERIAEGLTRIPLRQVGSEWTPRDALAVMEIGLAVDPLTGVSASTLHPPVLQRLFMPVIGTSAVAVGPDLEPPPDLPPDDPTECPCGWFTLEGRMLDYVPSP